MKKVISTSLSVALLAELFLIYIIYFNTSKVTPPYNQDLMPWISALFNACSACSLLTAFVCIKTNRKKAHIIWIHITLVFSAAFLVNYILYHLSVGHVIFKHSFLRPYYLLLLISHLSASFISLPLIFLTYALGATKRLRQHKKIAKYTFSLWMYVSVTGVIIVLFLKLLNHPG